jgi:hypothetical protein
MLILVCLVEQIEKLDRGYADGAAGAHPLEQPSIGPGWPFGRGRSGPQFDHGLTAAGDDHFFAFDRSIDEFGEMVFGVCDAVRCHSE